MMPSLITITSYQDVALGAVAALGAVLLYQIRSFLYVESCASIQKRNKAPIPQLGHDDGTITVWGFQKTGTYTGYAAGVCDGSPYVSRVECFLRLHHIPYTKLVSADLSENPRGKLPFANVYGVMMDDSERILEEVQAVLHASGHVPPSLSAEQIRNGHFLRRLLTGSLYWIRYSMNFGCETGRQAIIDQLKKDVPAFLAPVIGAMVIKSQQANMHGQGIGRRPFDEIISMGQDDLRMLNALLGNQEYILGTEDPTVYDTDLYAFVAALLYDTTPASMEWVQDIKKEIPQLVQYTDRMRTLLFSDYSKEKTS